LPGEIVELDNVRACLIDRSLVGIAPENAVCSTKVETQLLCCSVGVLVVVEDGGAGEGENAMKSYIELGVA
jgi:hypothetical protein